MGGIQLMIYQNVLFKIRILLFSGLIYIHIADFFFSFFYYFSDK